MIPRCDEHGKWELKKFKGGVRGSITLPGAKTENKEKESNKYFVQN